MVPRKFLGVLFSMLATQATAQASLGQLTMGTWDGSLEAGLGLSKDRSSYQGATSDFSQRNSMYNLNVQNTGFSVIDPGLVTGSARLTLGMGNDVSDGLGLRTSTVSTGLQGYLFEAEFLNARPYGGAVLANRSHTNTIQPFGHQDTRASYRALTLRLNEGSPLKDMGFPYLSANLRLEQQVADQLSTSVFNQNYQFSERRTSLIQDGHKGGVSSDLSWRYEFNDIKQPLSLYGDSRNQSANLDYSADFGEQLNRRWDSHINYSRRAGAIELFNLTTLSIGEVLQIVHRNNLSTSYNYQLLHVVERGEPNLSQVGKFAIQYSPYQNVSASAWLQRQTALTGKVDSGSAALGYQRVHGLPGLGRLTFTASGDYGQTSTTSTTTTGRIDYEAHPFKFDQAAVNQEVTLGQGFVDMSTPPLVYLFKVNVPVDSLPLDQCTNTADPRYLTGGCDYILDSLGNKTIIRVNPRSNRLSPGNFDALAVSYNYNVPPTSTYATITSSTGLTIDYKWIVFALTHAQSEMHLRSGERNPFLQNSRRDRAQLDLNGSWRHLQAAAGVAYQAANETLLVSRQQQYYGSATYPYTDQLFLGFNADRLMSQYQDPERSSQTDSMRLSATWYPADNMSVNALLGRRSRMDSGQENETVDEASVKALMRFGKVRLTSSLNAAKRSRGASELSNWAIYLSLVRDL